MGNHGNIGQRLMVADDYIHLAPVEVFAAGNADFRWVDPCEHTPQATKPASGSEAQTFIE